MQLVLDMTPLPPGPHSRECDAVASNILKFRPGFWGWVSENLHIVRGFFVTTDALRKAGRRRWAAGEILYYLRMETGLSEVHSEWKINHNHARDLATLYVLMHEGSDGFFRFKRREA